MRAPVEPKKQPPSSSFCAPHVCHRHVLCTSQSHVGLYLHCYHFCVGMNLLPFHYSAMFEGGRGIGGGGGVPDQFRHFMASRSSISLPISFPHHGVAAVVSSPPLPLSFGGAGAASASGFESYPPPPPPAALFPPPSHRHQQHRSGLLSNKSTTAAEDLKEEAIIGSSSRRLLATNNLLLHERERSIILPAVVSSSPPSSDHSSIEPSPSSSSSSSSWTNDEVLALLRIRSSMENWFPDFTWEHVSRKLAELGFQRSAEKCKEKFEEESRNFSTNYSSRFLVSDLDEQVLYNHNNDENNPQVISSSPATAEKAQDNNNNNLDAKERNDYEKELVLQEEEGNNHNVAVAINGNKGCDEEKMILMCRKRRKKRKRAEEEKKEEEEEEFEMFKGFCETIVRRIIGQQEELHNKLIEDMIRRDEESIAREEAWRIQEIDRINKEMEKRSREQAISGDRQAKIIDFLKKFMVTSELIPPHHHQQQQQQQVDQNNIVLIKNKFQDLLHKLTNPSNTTTTTSNNNPTSSSSTENTVPSPPPPPPPAHHHHDHMSHGSKNPNEVRMGDEKGGERDTSTGKRWPRDEVLALINLRCSLNNNNNNNGDYKSKDAGGGGGSSSSTKGNNSGSSTLPLWERISQMMVELGYQRSAKRCKEKWENINKYFRKTKDNKKKRSMDSRTCPYFHQLSNLYSQAPGTSSLVGPSLLSPHNQENHS